MRILFDNARNRFFLESDYNERFVVKDAGFRWDPEAKVWHASDSTCVKRLKGTPGLTITTEALEKFQASQEKVKEAVSQSRATDADITIQAPPGLEYLPFQKAGIAYASARQDTLIADEMGLGKTIQAIGTVNADKFAHRILILCPATLKLNWKKEFLKWDVKHLSVGLISAGKKKWPDADVIIINYELLGKWQAQLRTVTWDIFAADECHYLKEGKTGRTQEVFGRKKTRKVTKKVKNEDGTISIQEIEREPLAPIAARRRLFLTGTPIVNRPKELWTLIQALDPDGLGSNWRKYAERYCAGYQTEYGYDWSGASNLSELQELLRSRFMVRRLKKDVLKELPAKRRAILVLETNKELKALIAKEPSLEEFEAALKSGAIDTPHFQQMSNARKAVAIAKVPFIIDHVNEVLNETSKVCVFVHHYDVVDSLRGAFSSGCVVVDGRTPTEERQAAVERFQTDATCCVFIGTIKAAGVGLTLTASSTVVFGELDWVPGNVTQAEDRCHRIGQRNQVLIQHLVLDGSLDERLAEVLIDKQKVLDAALDTEPITDDAPVAEVADVVAIPVSNVPKKTGILWKDPDFPEERVRAIHSGLRILAGMCDGARVIDNAGFNKLDTDFGTALAAAKYLTPKMVKAGLALVTRYSRQLPEQLLQQAGVKRDAA